MEGAYVIRSAIARDVEFVVALERRIDLAPHWRAEDYFASLHKHHASNVGNNAGLKRCFFVAESTGSIVGFAVGKVVLGHTAAAELETVAVADSSRRLGIGRALCAAVIDWAQEWNAKEMELEVRGESSGPIALYSSLGFLKKGWRAKYYRDPVDDAVLMRLDMKA